MKKFKSFLLIILVLPLCWMLSGCSLESYVTGIEKTSEIGDSAVYTVYYSNGKTTNFTVENGKDAEDVDIEGIFSACVERGLYENSNEGFNAFLKDYLSFEIDDTTDTQAINKALLSMVEVYSKFTIKPSYIGAETTALGCGAGFVYKMTDDYSYIITNYHVVYSEESTALNGIADTIKIYQYGVDKSIYKDEQKVWHFEGDYVNASYIGGSIDYDIAILKVNTTDLTINNEDTRAVDIADGYKVGDDVYAIGNSDGAGTSVTKGIVSVDSEYISLEIESSNLKSYRVMRIDASVNGGNSGGGAFNSKGELIGVVNSKTLTTSDGTVIEGMAYALPYDNITKVADNIIYYYEDGDSSTNGLNKFELGIQYTIENSSAIYDEIDGSITIKDNLKIVSILSDSIAKDKFEVDDIITELTINNVTYTIDRSYQLADLLLTVREGDNLLFTVIRDGNILDEPVEIKDVSAEYIVAY